MAEELPTFGDICTQAGVYLCFACGDHVSLASGEKGPVCPTCEAIGPYKLVLPAADERDRVADARELAADRRDWVADKRDLAADRREQTLDEREAAANRRYRTA